MPSISTNDGRRAAIVAALVIGIIGGIFYFRASVDAPPPAPSPLGRQSVPERSDIDAQIALAKSYLHGAPGIPEDRGRAKDLFSRAAAEGNPIAAYYMGTLAEDMAGAAAWFEKAANAGVAQAMFLLGNAYRAGNGVARDDAKALAWYERAGELDHAAALQTLAMAYLHGEMGLSPDESEYRRYEMEAEHALQHPQTLP